MDGAPATVPPSRGLPAPSSLVLTGPRRFLRLREVATQLKEVGDSGQPQSTGPYAMLFLRNAIPLIFASAGHFMNTSALAQTTTTTPAPVCSDRRVIVEGWLEERWKEPLRLACATLAAMTDADPTARVSIRAIGDDLVVNVVLADGRVTLRRLRAVAALSPTLEALVALPVEPAVHPAIDRAEPPKSSSAHAEPVPTPLFGVEFGGGGGSRVSSPGPYLAASVSGFVQVRGGPWLVGTEMRWDPWESVRAVAPAAFESETLALSMTIARRLETSFGHVDLGVAPRLVSQTQSAIPPTGEENDTEVDVRPAAFSRAGFGHGNVRFMLEADADVSPTRLRRNLRALPDFPQLPSWSAGFTLGLEWASQ